VRQALANTALASLVRIGALGILLAAGERSGQIGMQAIGWGGVGGTILGAIQTRRLWSLPAAVRSAVWEQHSAMARWLVPGSVGTWIATEVYPLLTAGLVSFAAAGAYRALLTVIAPVHVYLKALDTYFAPRVAGSFDAGGRPALARSLRRLYLLALLPVGAVTVAAAWWPGGLLRLFYGETYVAYSAGLPLMAAAYVLWGLYAPLQMVFRAARMTRPIFLANSAATLAMFTVGVWAILRWGLYGAIGGQALNAALTALILAVSWRAWWKSGTAGGSAALGAV
jgi:O-antigen/teichoic acid export membrane protein